MHRYGLPDESCANYVAEASASCDAQAVCSNCMPLGEDVTVYKCWPVPSPILYYVHSYGSVHGEAAMMSEIIARGPITCGFASVDDFDYGYVRHARNAAAAPLPARCRAVSHSPVLPCPGCQRGGVYVDTTNATEMNHDVEVVGWGETEDGLRYWRARNSWGSYWGENSFFLIARGINNMQFESDCTFALFDVHHLLDVLRGRMGGSMFGIVQQRDEMLNMSRTQPHVQDSREDEGRTRHKQHSGRSSHSGKEEEREEEAERGSRHAMANAEAGSAQSAGSDAWRLHEFERAQEAEQLMRQQRSPSPQPLQAGGRAASSGQQEVDDNTRDRESRQQQSRQLEEGERLQRQLAQIRGGGRHESEHAARDDLYVEQADSSEEQRKAEQRIMQAIRAAYTRERARGQQAGSSASQRQQEQRERQQDETAIAAAIHSALHSIDHNLVRAMVVRCLHQLESESEQQATAGGGSDSGADARRQRDVDVVEDEVGRMWRLESSNAHCGRHPRRHQQRRAQGGGGRQEAPQGHREGRGGDERPGGQTADPAQRSRGGDAAASCHGQQRQVRQRCQRCAAGSRAVAVV